MKKKILKILAYVGLFFLLSVPLWIGVGLAGSNSWYAQIDHNSNLTTPILAPSIIGGILFEVPWLMACLFKLIPAEPKLIIRKKN